MDGKSVFVSLICCMVLSACQKQPAAQTSEIEKPTLAQTVAATPSAAVLSSPGTIPTVGTGNTAYDKVASKLDAGGVSYVYWSAEKILGELSNKFGPIAEAAESGPHLTSGEKERLHKYFDLASRYTAASGIQAVKALGFSSKEVEPGIFLNKSFLYAPGRSGFLWDTFAKSPHDFVELQMVPENAEGFAFYDFDLPLFWRAVAKELKSADIPAVTQWEAQISQQIQSSVGLTLDELLDSLSDQLGVIVTLNSQSNIEIPLGNKPYKMPAPAAALVWKVKNEKLFDGFDALAKGNPKVESTEEADLKMRVLKGMTELPYVSPTLARTGDYLIFSTSEEIVRAMVRAKSGKAPGIKSSSIFTRLAAGLPEKGNCVAYTSKTFQKTFAELQAKLSEVQEAQSPLLQAMTTKFAGLYADLASYGVGSAVEDGWLAYGKATQDINQLLGEFALLPAYFFALAAIEHTEDASQNNPLTKIKENLANLRAAKEEAVSEKNFENGQLLTRQDVEEYLAAWPDSVVGETYEVGAVGQPPYATAPVDVGNCPAGKKIEP